MLDLATLKFDDFPRSAHDVVCIQPVRTIVRLEEEITIVKKVRKVEEIDVSPSCPTRTYPAHEYNGSYAYSEQT
jgi:hypothetical protein